METSKDKYNSSKLVISKAVRKYIKIDFLLQFKDKSAAKRACAVYRLLP